MAQTISVLDEWLTTKDVGERFNVPSTRVLRMIRLGRIKARKFNWVWVVHVSDLPESWPPPQHP